MQSITPALKERWSMHCNHRLVITGDDFGLSAENNAGVMAAYREGVLSATSLMVGGDTADEAVDLARQHPGLSVGLHVSLHDTRPIQPPETVSLLVGSDGRFRSDDTAYRVALRSAKGRRQVQTEIAAQYRSFAASGLLFDHVNTHRHILRNPVLACMVLREAARWSVPATRIPWPAEHSPSDPPRYARAILLRRLAAFYGIAAPDRTVGGQPWSAGQIIDLVTTRYRGVTELYFHPVTAHEHMYSPDLPALLDERVGIVLRDLSLHGLCRATQVTKARRRSW